MTKLSNQTRHARAVREGVNEVLEALAALPGSRSNDHLLAALECFNVALEMADLNDEKRLAAALWEVTDIIQTGRDQLRSAPVIPFRRK